MRMNRAATSVVLAITHETLQTTKSGTQDHAPGANHAQQTASDSLNTAPACYSYCIRA